MIYITHLRVLVCVQTALTLLEVFEMAKIKNEDYLKDAKSLAEIMRFDPKLNCSSVANLKVYDFFAEENDGPYAFIMATRAYTMHRYDLNNR